MDSLQPGEGAAARTLESRDEAFRRYEEEDRRILDVAVELCNQLNIAGFKPEHLEWVTFYLWTPQYSMRLPQRDVPSDQPVLRGNRVVLRSSMDGKLTPDEWRPLLASSLIYDKTLGAQRILGWVGLRLVPTVLIVAGLLWILIPLLPAPSSAPPSNGSSGRGFAALSIVLAVAVYVFILEISAPYMKRLRLRADRVAADRLANRSEFIGVLKKVDGFHLPDIERRKGFLGHLSSRPSITQRIQSLQADGLASQSQQ